MTGRTGLPLLATLVALGATAAQQAAIRRDGSYRLILDWAGDTMLPGLSIWPDPDAINRLASNPDAPGRAAYLHHLGSDNVLVLFLLASFLAIAWTLRRRVPRFSFAVAIASLLYAIADWGENTLLRMIFAGSVSGADAALHASLATSAKWLLLFWAVAAAILGLLRLLGPGRAWWRAFFLDVPHVVDSMWRHADYAVNKEFYYVAAATKAREAVESHARLEQRPCWRTPAFLFFSLTAAFIAYGPTPDGLCVLLPQPLPRLLPVIPGLLLAYVLWRLFRYTRGSMNARIESRFRTTATSGPATDPALLASRRDITMIAIWSGLVLMLIPVAIATVGLFMPVIRQTDICAGANFQWLGLARFALCAGAIGAFAVVCGSSSSTAFLLRAQAVILAAEAGLLWFALAPAEATEASGLPYRHLFAAVAPAMLAALWIGPSVAGALLDRGGHLRRALRIAPVEQQTRRFFRRLLRRRELFQHRDEEPQATPNRVLLALLESVSYRILQLALPPAIFAFVAPAEWLAALTMYGAILALLLSVWGNMSRRWQQMSRQVERWFLSGTAFFVSVFVIVVAGLRVAGVDYVTTILDAAPFGVVFAVVVMSYVLSWLVEDRMNRVLAAELLGMMSGGRATTCARYDFSCAPQAAIRVAQAGRFLSHYALGRFAAIGTLRATAGRTASSEPAFHTYELLDLFRVLAGDNSDRVAEVIRNSRLYFYVMNVMLLFVAAAFVAACWHLSRGEPQPVLVVGSEPHEAELKDLGALLREQSSVDRPAIVLVGSGGGTRAALYTSHVLQGLHGLGADRDIVLTSGVSGGGVALAYFAANYRELTESTPAADESWQRFRRDIAGDVIGDVLEGASEWRILGASSLSALLAESINRHLLPDAAGQRTMATPAAPPLILNTTIAGHPAEDSEILMKTLNGVDEGADAACREVARPYRMMNGGRLIFTNLRNTDAFPGEKALIPNTRLPYVVVKDPRASLSHAAALNANFPPIFPNARVSMPARVKGTQCPERSYFVTDGGAQENLGLVSALFAVQSALGDLRAECARGGCRLRPLHFVIAEASATGYDYEQDRGISAGLGGSRERLTGGLTNLLIERLRDQYSALSSNAATVRFHYLPLPLPFRARGGFGTHWMHAGSFDVVDPRLRVQPGMFDRAHVSSGNISRKELDAVWLALHDAHTPYCSNTGYGSITTDRIRRWICGARDDRAAPRDLHVEEWQTLVTALRR